MTRKRKNVESGENPPAKNPFEGYGYTEEKSVQNFNESPFNAEKFGYGNRNREHHGGRDFRRNDRWGSKRQFGERDFESKYGQVGGNGSCDQPENTHRNESIPHHDSSLDGGQEFPKEIVGYLRSIEQIKKKEGKIEEYILEKCAEEVAGHETTLLAWTEAAVVVESVFGSCPKGAAMFLSSVSRLKHKKLADLMFSGASARTIENLIFSMCPIENVEHIELLQTLTGILIDNWNDSVTSQPSSFLMRAIVWVCCGLSARPKAGEEKKRNYKRQEMKTGLKKVYEKLAVLAFDENLNRNFFDSTVFVTLFQDFIEADALLGDKRGDEYVKKKIEKDDIDSISNAWYSANGSRVWEKLVENCSEDARSLLWLEFCSKNVEDLTDNKFANFPLQKMISSSTSLETVTEIIETMSPKCASLIQHQNSGVFFAVLRCAARYASTEQTILQKLRKYFRSSSEAKKSHFLLNALTMNDYDGSNFDVQKFTQKGAMLVSELVNFSRTKTISAGFESLTDLGIQEMSCNKYTSRLIQAVLASKTMPEGIKEKIIGAFNKDSWERLITDTYGSRVFEKIWDFVEVKRKQEIMKILVGIHNSSKFWKFAMLRCDLYLFRKSRKDWVEKMKKVQK